MSKQRFPELGFFTCPGYALDPKNVFEEVTSGSKLGFGSVWISERFNTKDIGVMSGIAAALAPDMAVTAGLVGNLPLRHPLALASYASTMTCVTDKFTLGIGRGMDQLADWSGTPRVTFKILETYIDLLRRMWNGEVVSHDGPLGKFDKVGLGMKLDNPPPIVMAVMGDKTSEWAGANCDGVLYNSLWSAQAIERSTAAVKRGAERAGRDPESVRVWTVQMTACETSEEDELNYIIRRMNTYVRFPPMFKVMCEFNGWDYSVAEKIMQKLDELDGKGYSEGGGVGDEHTTRNLDDLRTVRDMYPLQWIEDGCAVGSADHCARLMQARFDAGADSVLFHGSPPGKIAPLLDVWDNYRPAAAMELPVTSGNK